MLFTKEQNIIVTRSITNFIIAANKKAETALREKEAALLKLAQMQKEIDNLSGGPLLHVIRRVQDLKTAPMGVLKTIEWQLRKDLQEVEKVILCHNRFTSVERLSFIESKVG